MHRSMLMWSVLVTVKDICNKQGSFSGCKFGKKAQVLTRPVFRGYILNRSQQRPELRSGMDITSSPVYLELKISQQFDMVKNSFLTRNKS